MDIMKPIASDEIPYGEEWVYEVKYDGFRCVLTWNKDGSIQLTSKNKKDLTGNFPEIIAFCQEYYHQVKDYLPLTMDGELVILNNTYQANFNWIQKRGRLKKSDVIQQISTQRPASFMAFDLLTIKGNTLLATSFHERKQELNTLFKNLPKSERIMNVPSFEIADDLWRIIFDYKGEGMIAKRKNSKYISGKGHQDWFKIKNWRTIEGFLTHYDRQNGYFTFNVFHNEDVYVVGKCKHGLKEDEAETLKKLFITNGEETKDGFSLPPAICAKVHTLDLHQEELREPEFVSLLPQTVPQSCTLTNLQIDLAMIPERIGISKVDKVYWPDPMYTKGNFLSYIREISPYMLPFLQNRALTLIRFPEGVDEDFFYQKHLPDYAPDFIDFKVVGDEKKIICNHMDAVVWFANHGTLEYHVPFQTVDLPKPIEIVFDLDPPDRDAFSLAIQAANLIKPILDDLGLISFVKTSGNKGIQIHIPIPVNSLTYDETAVFTQAVAYTVEGAFPHLFTTERMKKKRQGRLYIDYVQHGKDKTIIAPYSPRRTKEGTVATPLYWEEVNENLRPEQFHIKNVLSRVKELGCPFRYVEEAREKQDLSKVLSLIKA
ncbi:DNA ligase D [Oceanobacillus sp. Castelsardo]|uniref:DNA ligase D n=1 Tax=Oceanobacillus sp. Castelsardo TaxID=1851204 RepID=UPI000837D0FF|nr:DNA ligase D [Oceanobacillus sp. Castelsardo]